MWGKIAVPTFHTILGEGIIWLNMQSNYETFRKSMNYKSNEAVLKQNRNILNKCEHIKMYDPISEKLS